jgi:hypothetical protein
VLLPEPTMPEMPISIPKSYDAGGAVASGIAAPSPESRYPIVRMSVVAS